MFDKSQTLSVVDVDIANAVNAEVARGKAAGLYIEQKIIRTGKLDDLSEEEFVKGLLRCEQPTFGVKKFGACHGFYETRLLKYVNKYNGTFRRHGANSSTITRLINLKNKNAQ